MKPTEWLMRNIKGTDAELALLFADIEQSGIEFLMPGEVPSWFEKVEFGTDVCAHGRLVVEAREGRYVGQLVHRTGGLPCNDSEQRFYRIKEGEES